MKRVSHLIKTLRDSSWNQAACLSKLNVSKIESVRRRPWGDLSEEGRMASQIRLRRSWLVFDLPPRPIRECRFPSLNLLLLQRTKNYRARRSRKNLILDRFLYRPFFFSFFLVFLFSWRALCSALFMECIGYLLFRFLELLALENRRRTRRKHDEALHLTSKLPLTETVVSALDGKERKCENVFFGGGRLGQQSRLAPSRSRGKTLVETNPLHRCSNARRYLNATVNAHEAPCSSDTVSLQQKEKICSTFVLFFVSRSSFLNPTLLCFGWHTNYLAKRKFTWRFLLSL